MKLVLPALFVLVVTLFPAVVLAENTFNQLLPINGEIKLLPWDEVDELIPRKSIFTIVDVESGKSFQVQRRAGSQHADIQPLTNKDTEVLKTIYREWSWKRRAAIVVDDGKMIAASMNGMPHGAGALDNGFNGHFCLHFLKSTTHGSSAPDPAHHLMVLKSAGKLDDYLSKQSPAELVNVLMLAINNTDTTLLRKLVPHDQSDKELLLLSRLFVTNWKVTANKQTRYFTYKAPTKVEIYIEENGTISTTINLTARRDPISSRWRFDITDLLEIANH
ncbi:hypothetical protein ABFG93_03265 [Pseudalkalibacillus hwajinpoensis]|uniref:hypothetical protein n=1 Tax=Guptibacillus hwajinpoensis TaxID=208199 RepID=UPI00325C04B2